MNDSEGFGLNNSGGAAQNAGKPQARAFGSPLPVGASGRTPLSPDENDSQRFRQPPPPGRALTNPSASSSAQQSSGMERAMGVLRLALLFVQRILPLLDGNIGAAVSNMLIPHPQLPPPPPPQVDLTPIEDGLVQLHTLHRGLRNQFVEQNSSLKRVEGQLEMVREATDRNTLEQQELLEDLKAFGNKVNMFAIFALGLLAVSILLNVILFLHIQRVLP
jgi:hypothetical protein